MALLTVALVIALLLLAVLVLPLGLEVASNGGQRRWSLILAGLHWKVSPRRLAKMRAKMRAKKQKPKPPEAKGRAKERLMRILRSLSTEPGTSPDKLEFADLEEAWRILKRVFSHIRFRVHRLDVTVATPDPAMTGAAYGWAWAARAMLPAKWPVTVATDFAQNRPGVDYDVEISAIPVLMLWEAIRFLAKRLWQKIGRRPDYS